MKICKEDECYNVAAPGRSRCYSHYGKTRRAEAKKIVPKAPDGKMKILYLDIETRPNLVWTWGLFNQNIGVNQIVDPCRMLCFSAKWDGQEETEFYSDWQDGQLQMVTEAWRLLNEADVIIHYYGSRFDRPHLYREFLLQGFTPPSRFKEIDLKMVVGKQFKFTSNKLQFVSEILGLGGKEEHEGFPLWTKVIAGDEDAQSRMKSYNIRDVILLDELYQVLLPWIPNHPSRHLYEQGRGCPTCGVDVAYMVETGYTYTKVSKFKAFRCNACNSTFRSTKREAGINITDEAWL